MVNDVCTCFNFTSFRIHHSFIPHFHPPPVCFYFMMTPLPCWNPFAFLFLPLLTFCSRPCPWQGHRLLKDGTRAYWATSARAARLDSWERRSGGFCSSHDERAAWEGQQGYSWRIEATCLSGIPFTRSSQQLHRVYRNHMSMSTCPKKQIKKITQHSTNNWQDVVLVVAIRQCLQTLRGRARKKCSPRGLCSASDG